MLAGRAAALHVYEYSHFHMGRHRLPFSLGEGEKVHPTAVDIVLDVYNEVRLYTDSR